MHIIKAFIVIGGILTLGIAIFHTRFYKKFKWQDDFEKIELKNSKIFYSIHIATILFFLIFAFISLIYARELSSGKGLARGITSSYSLFWLWRTVWQVVYFKPLRIEENRARARVIFFLSVYIALTIIYLLPLAAGM